VSCFWSGWFDSVYTGYFFFSARTRSGLVYPVTITHFQVFALLWKCHPSNICWGTDSLFLSFIFCSLVEVCWPESNSVSACSQRCKAARGNNSASFVLFAWSKTFHCLMMYSVSFFVIPLAWWWWWWLWWWRWLWWWWWWRRPYTDIFDNISSTYLTSLGFDLMAICTQSSVLTRAECFCWNINILYLWWDVSNALY
jgi:hypothetical protein